MHALDALAPSHPSLQARARELSPDGGDELLSEAYLRLCQADVEGRLLDRSAQGIKRWVRSALLNVLKERARRPAWVPDAEDFQLAGIL